MKKTTSGWFGEKRNRVKHPKTIFSKANRRDQGSGGSAGIFKSIIAKIIYMRLNYAYMKLFVFLIKS